MFFTILIASLIGSIFALIGGVVLLWKENFARKISLDLVSFAVGTLLGAAFFELLPEATERIEGKLIFAFPVLGILLLFLIEKILRWRHCHGADTCDIHETHIVSKMVLVGDAFHNFVDGLIIALSFSLDFSVGITATIAVFLHEIPQEIGDFGVLLRAGYAKKKVFLCNLFTALATPAGAIVGYFALPLVGGMLPFLTAFAAGIFIYIAISDLMPELRDHGRGMFDVGHIFAILLGLLIVWVLGILIAH